MIRAEAGAAVSKFLSVSFLDLISHFCDTDSIAPCSEAKCELTEEEWNAIPEWFTEEIISFGLPAFDEVGGMPFIRKKIAQLVKIAKAEIEIRLDLVSELILFLIGINGGVLEWKDDKGVVHTPEEPINYVKVPRTFPSSQRCSCCGRKESKVKDLTVRKWKCPACGAEHDRDVNAAVNILNKGLEMLAS